MTELGELLKKTREEKGLSLHDIQESTKIQSRYLEAIERGDFDALPGQFYARAFIRRYAEVLGIKTEEILTQFSNEIPSPVTPIEVEESSPILQKNNAKKEMFVPSGKWISRVLIAVSVVVVLSVIWLVVSNYQSNKNAAPIPDQQNSGVNKTNPDSGFVPPPKQTEPEKPAETPAAGTEGTLTPINQDAGKSIWTYELTGASKVVVTVTAKTGEKWVNITTPKGFNEQITLKQGESKTWEIADSNEVSFYMHNATTVEVKINGQTIDTTKSPTGSSQHFKVTRKNS